MGGQERVALDLAVGQKVLNHSVIVISLSPGPDGPLAQDFHTHGIPTHTLPKRAGFDPTLPARLAWRFFREGVEVVHTHNPQPLIYGAPAAKLARARAIHTKHGANPDGGRRLQLRRAAARFCDAYVAVSEITAEVARKNREVPEHKLHTIANGIDLARFHPDAGARKQVRAELRIPEDAFVVGTVGRLAPEKDQQLLIRALGPHLSPTLQLVIVGDGSERSQLERAAAGHAPFVHLAGARRDTPRLYAAFDLFALSSKTEGLPLVLPEAMASGLPVVSTAVGGIPQVITPEVGELVPAGDAAQLAKVLTALAADPKRARALGERARHAALQKYSAERMVNDYLRLYVPTLSRV
jgi:glycosyltransferase involved in cell wall biosynthesis